MADTALIQLIRRARARAVVMVVVGAGIAATAITYIGLVSTVLGAGFSPAHFAIWSLGVIPLVIGLPIAIYAGARILALRRLETRPEDVVATELALRFGEPALRFCFAGDRSVVLVTGELDRDVLAASLAGRVPEARVVPRSRS